MKLAALLILIPVTALALMQSTTTTDPISEFQTKLRNGKARLEFEPQHGYLQSLLKNLNIPVSSQGLVFSKTSFQYPLISPAKPRALYFNDETYVGWVQNAPVLEIISVDPKLGPIFYSLSQDKDNPEFQRQSGHCLVCHYYFDSKMAVTRLVVLSVLPDAAGNDVGTPLFTSDESPLEYRWGGWYVTGTHGRQRHLGNTMVRASLSDNIDVVDYISKLDVTRGSNVTDLSTRIDTKPYLSPHSDIASLMVLVHQANVHNLITLASTKIKANSSDKAVDDVGEQLLKLMLFADEAQLTEPVQGTSNFAVEFASQGPRDRQGRSLRDLDLNRRLLRYPLSYTIYTKSFDAIPARVKQYVYRRLREVLNGRDTSAAFKLSEADRQAILEILRDTKPEVVGPAA